MTIAAAVASAAAVAAAAVAVAAAGATPQWAPAAAHGGAATTSSTRTAAAARCPSRPAAPVGHVGRVYTLRRGCAFLQARDDANLPYERFRALVVRRKANTYTLAFPWPAFSKVVAGTCHGQRQTFVVAWPLVTYSIPLCALDGTPVALGTLGGTNRATGIFRVVTGPSGTPLRLSPVVVPPPFR